ncbi:hypothetical protein [Citrobacter portucalensis]
MSNSCDVISPCSCCYTNLSNSSATPLPTTCDGQVVLLGALAEYRLDPDTHTGTTLRE